MPRIKTRRIEAMMENEEPNLSTAARMALLIARTDGERYALKMAVEHYGSVRSMMVAGGAELVAGNHMSVGLATRVNNLRLFAEAFYYERKALGERFRSGSEIFKHYHLRLRDLKVEQFWAVLLDGKNRVMREFMVSQGSLTSSLVHPREVFAQAIRYSAAAVVFVHNHPSGDPTPSVEDIEITRRLCSVAELVGIRVLDHVVVGDGAYVSFLERGLLGDTPVSLRGRPGGEVGEGRQRGRRGQSRFAVVRGHGDFPLDMLRYDACHPLYETDSLAIRRGSLDGYCVLLRSDADEVRWTPDRWASFGWRLEATFNDAALALDRIEGLTGGNRDERDFRANTYSRTPPKGESMGHVGEGVHEYPCEEGCPNCKAVFCGMYREKGEPGSISTGTLRPLDLFNAFTKAADLLLIDEEESDGVASRIIDAKKDGYFESEKAVEDLCWLEDLLNKYAPEGHYFGAHPGDGADFGFWPEDEDPVRMTVRLAVKNHLTLVDGDDKDPDGDFVR